MTESATGPDGPPPLPDVAAEIIEFNQLQQQVHELVAQLAITISKLEHLRQHIEQYILPAQQ
ncbi:hypothetical protein [Allorhizocola rhizosphaerae]|uniref:hypothetical protein n=1 Tax=Allorhizocola rhizosphaerae TaxID=1872709 RepID=UPI000E3B6CCC|nr:hypothetical protein [Allorhizocola rhizosphaerae]